MSAQLLTAMLQAPFSRLGQLVIEPHPIDASESSSPVPQIPSAPPQWALRRRWSFACALAMRSAVIESAWQSEFAATCPRTLPSSHLPSAFIFDWMNFEDSFAIERWHLRGSPRTGLAAKSSTCVASTTVAERRGAGISLTSNVRGRTSPVCLCRKTPVCVTKSRQNPVLSYRKRGRSPEFPDSGGLCQSCRGAPAGSGTAILRLVTSRASL